MKQTTLLADASNNQHSDVVPIVTTMGTMKSVPIREAKTHLSALIEEVESTHEIVQITKNGKLAAVLIAPDELESLRETLFWLSKPGIRETIQEAERERSAGNSISISDLRAELGSPPAQQD